MTGMTSIVKRIAGMMTPAILLLGLVVIMNGHVTPGGGFAGGILVAGSFVLLILAFGLDPVRKEFRQSIASIVLSTGLILFWSLAVTGLIRGSFFQNIKQGTSDSASHFLSGGLIPFYDIAISLGVSAALVVIFMTFLIAKERSNDR